MMAWHNHSNLKGFNCQKMSEKPEIVPLKATLGLTQAHTNTET
jgi:hypothetical protein